LGVGGWELGVGGSGFKGRCLGLGVRGSGMGLGVGAAGCTTQGSAMRASSGALFLRFAVRG
jgi:hypothetical protein